MPSIDSSIATTKAQVTIYFYEFQHARIPSKKEKIDKYEVEKVYFEPITGCKHPIIASRATPIGSAEHATR
jgi:hypothetical protein